MKSLIPALIILLCVIVITILGSFFIDSQLERFSQSIKAYIPSDTTDIMLIYDGALRIESDYENIKKHLFLFIHDNAVSEIEEHIEEIKSASRLGEKGDAITAKNRLILHIEQLRRFSKFSLEAIV